MKRPPPLYQLIGYLKVVLTPYIFMDNTCLNSRSTVDEGNQADRDATALQSPRGGQEFQRLSGECINDAASNSFELYVRGAYTKSTNFKWIYFF